MGIKTKALLALVATLSWLLPAGWLFASGNMPAICCENSAVVSAVNRTWPRLSAATFVTSRKICRDLRREGIPVPATHNERLMVIVRLRQKVDYVCNLILKDSGKETVP